MTPRRPTRTALAAALAFTCTALLAAGTPAFAQSQDLRSPDAKDAAASAFTPAGQDLRSADARDAGQPATVELVDADLRTADARDAGTPAAEPVPGLPTWPLDPVPVSTPEPVVITDTPTAFQWDDAAAGAAGMLGLVLVLAGIAALITRRQRAATV